MRHVLCHTIDGVEREGNFMNKGKKTMTASLLNTGRIASALQEQLLQENLFLYLLRHSAFLTRILFKPLLSKTFVLLRPDPRSTVSCRVTLLF